MRSSSLPAILAAVLLGLSAGCTCGGGKPGVDGGAGGGFGGGLGGGGGSPGTCADLPDGVPCGDPSGTDCDLPDSCFAGVCVPNHLAAGTACGDQSSTDCSQPDVCDAQGVCQANDLADGASCGDTSSSPCDAPDTCLGGVCQTNRLAAGAACGDSTVSACTAADTCDAMGVCQPNDQPDGTACGDSSTSACDGADSCLAGVCAPNHVTDGTPCGSTASSTCDAPDSCLGGVCAPNYATTGTPCGSTTDTQCNHADGCDGMGGCSANVELDGMACADCPAGPGQCGGCLAGVCPNVCASLGVTSLSTGFAGGNDLNGNLFDVTAANAVVVSEITVNPLSAGAYTFEVYTTPGGIAGKVTSATGWTKQTTISATIAAPGAFKLPVTFNIPLAAGSTTGFYVTSTVSTLYLAYTDGTLLGNTAAADGNLTIKQGYGNAYPFGTNYNPRTWNGTLGYVVGAGLTVPVGGTVNAEGVAFDVHALQTTRVSGLSLRLAPGTHTVSAWWRPGSHVGFENDSMAWYPLGTFPGLAGGAAVPITFTPSIAVPAGASYGFYVSSPSAGGAFLVSPGSTVGTVAASNARLQVLVGSAVTNTFGGVTSTQTWDGVVSYVACP